MITYELEIRVFKWMVNLRQFRNTVVVVSSQDSLALVLCRFA